MIYFIAVRGQPYVKVGKADNVKRRLTQLQISSPFKLDVLHTGEGDEWAEATLHEHFEPASVRGEWFSLDHPLIQEALEWLKSGIPIERYLSKIILDAYQRRVAAIEEHNRKVRLINLINRFKARENKSKAMQQPSP